MASGSLQADELIRAAVLGSEEASAALYELFSPPAFRTAIGLLGDVADAEEVVQDSFVYAFRNLGRFDAGRSAFQTWLLTIVISRCRNKRRRKLLLTIPLNLWSGQVEAATSREVEETLVRRGVKRDVWRAVRELTPKLSEAVVLRYFAGLHYKEMAEIMGCNPKTAESRVRAGVQAMRERLSRQGVTSLEEFWKVSWP